MENLITDNLKERWTKVWDDAIAADDAKNVSVAKVESTLLKIREHEQNIAAAKDKRDKQIAFFQKFIDNAKNDYALDIAEDLYYIDELKKDLQAFFDANPPKGRKSIKFAAGSFGYNKNQTKFFFNGNEANANNPDFVNFCACANGLPQFIKAKEYLDWAELKKNLDADDDGNVFRVDTGELIHELRAQKVFSVKTI